MENVRVNRDIKLVTAKNRRNCLVSEQNYNTKMFSTENILAIEMKKSQKVRNNQACLLGFTNIRSK